MLGAAALLGCNSQLQTRAPWVVVHRGGEAIASIDTSRIAHAGDSLQVWIRFDYEAADALPDDPGGGTFKRVDVHTRLHCAERGVHDLRMELRDSAGVVVHVSDEPTSWRAWQDHPFGEYVFPAVCALLT